MRKEILMAHVDYENIRKGFPFYVEFIKLDDVIRAIESLGKELGELRQIFFYGDWTRRPNDARMIEERGFRAVNVLSKIYGGDRSDPTMSFAIDDQSRENSELTAFLLGAGDADYKEVILRCRERGKRIYATCFGHSASRELFTMTEGVYPLEVRLSLHERQQMALPTLEILNEPGKERHLIQRLDSLEKRLPVVVRSYFRDKILLPTGYFGETPAEVEGFLESVLSEGYIEEYNSDNPKMPGKQVKCLRLKREIPIVAEVLSSKETGQIRKRSL